jgi:hypothetical protein
MRFPYLVLVGCLAVSQSCGRPFRTPPPGPAASVPPRDTVPAADRYAIWEAVLRFYRSGRVLTEADKASLVHARLGVEPHGRTSERAPVILATTRQPSLFDSGILAAYDSAWLRDMSEQHLVAGFCSARRLTSCEDSVLTTYLSLDDPYVWNGMTIVELWETALNPALCRRKDVIVDHQGSSLEVSNASGEWSVIKYDMGWHETASCSLVRKSGR